MYIYTTICIKEIQEKTVQRLKNPRYYQLISLIIYEKMSISTKKYRFKYGLY